MRNTTWTATRDGGEGATFMQPNYYDGQGMMVASDSGFTSIADMSGEGLIVCVAQGTTTEGNAAAESARLGFTWEVRPFAEVDLLQEAFVAGQCDGWSSDTSQLVGLRSTYPEGPDALTILPEVFSKEPLAPAVADGDTQWAQAVNWAIIATIAAEELGITSENVDTFADTEDINIQRFLGLTVGEMPPCSIRASVCRPTSPTRWSARSVTTARSLRSTSHRSDSNVASTPSGTTAV